MPNHPARVLVLHAWISFPGSVLDRAMHSALVGEPRRNDEAFCELPGGNEEVVERWSSDIVSSWGLRLFGAALGQAAYLEG